MVDQLSSFPDFMCESGSCFLTGFAVHLFKVENSYEKRIAAGDG